MKYEMRREIDPATGVGLKISVNASKENPYINSLKSARSELEDAEEAMHAAHRRRREALTQAATVGALGMGLIAKELGISRTLAYRILKEEKPITER